MGRGKRDPVQPCNTVKQISLIQDDQEHIKAGSYLFIHF